MSDDEISKRKKQKHATLDNDDASSDDEYDNKRKHATSGVEGRKKRKHVTSDDDESSDKEKNATSQAVQTKMGKRN